MRVTILDYGTGNLHSLVKALARHGHTIRVEADARAAARGDLLVLPGVGAFGAAARRLGPGRATLRAALRDGLPCLGICLGMQLLFERSQEGRARGIGFIPGRVTRVAATRVPHIGWNEVRGPAEPLLARSGLSLGWFANGFACRPAEASCVTAWTTHEHDVFPAMVRQARAMGVQFHPEKSSTAGLLLLRAALDELSGIAA